MKLFLDENLSWLQAGALRERGHDAIAAAEAGLAGAPDERIRAFAIETGRILLTLDADFANILRFPPADTPGVVRLKVHPPTEEAIRELIFSVVGTLADVPLAGCLAVVDGRTVRIRRQVLG